MTAARILIVDDDQSIRDALCDYLGDHGFVASAVSDGRALDDILDHAAPDLILLDLMLPGEDGLSICRRLAGQGPPILMLTAAGGTTDRVVGLELGADDYLPKPFDPRELLARIRALLRRSYRTEGGRPGQAIRFGEWRFIPDERRLIDPAGESVSLTAGEVALLGSFMSAPGRVLARDQLLEQAWGPEAEQFDRAVDLSVSRLRRKLAERDATPLIETVRGEGYRFLPSVLKPR